MAQPAAEDTAVSPPKAFVAQPSPSRVAPLAFGIAALVVGAAAGVLGYEGLSQSDAVDEDIRESGSGNLANITRAHAQQRLTPANDLFTGSLVAACTAGALAVLAIVLFLIN